MSENRIKKIKEGNNINVYLDGKIYESFHEIADDYAFTNARKCVECLNSKIHKGEI